MGVEDDGDDGVVVVVGVIDNAGDNAGSEVVVAVAIVVIGVVAVAVVVVAVAVAVAVVVVAVGVVGVVMTVVDFCSFTLEDSMLLSLLEMFLSLASLPLLLLLLVVDVMMVLVVVVLLS